MFTSILLMLLVALPAASQRLVWRQRAVAEKESPESEPTEETRSPGETEVTPYRYGIRRMPYVRFDRPISAEALRQTLALSALLPQFL